MRLTQIQLATIFISFALFVFLSYSMDTLPKKLQIKTSPKVISATKVQNISICSADCISCQNRTGNCERCFGPWFELDSTQCILPTKLYKLQSTDQEKRFQNFLPSSEWFFNSTPVQSTKKCIPDPLALNISFNLLGPFGLGNLNYQRTISQHNYFALKFLLVLMNWTTPQTSLTITIYNQGRIILANQILTVNSPQIKDSYRQKICSPENLDRRVSVMLEIAQTQTSQIFIQFAGLMTGSAQWGLSSFILTTGLCNAKCQSCVNYSPKIQNCDICRYFLAHSSTGQKCSTCLSGFYLKDDICYKCPIQFKQCKSGENNAVVGLQCQYPSLTNLANNCKFDNSIYFDRNQINDLTFFGSLYTINNGGMYVYRCGNYSVVGPVKFGAQISRVFLTLPPHIEISINFNLFTFNQENVVERFLIKILIDDQQFPFLPTEVALNITGTSSQCSMDNSVASIGYNGFKTVETEKFLKHRKTENVRVTISVDTSSKNSVGGWGIRDVRLVFKRCGENCDICTDQGCQACKKFFELKQYECATCIINTGKNSNGQCVPCNNQNCMTCNVTKDNKTQCTKCMAGYYLYTINNVTTCQNNPNFGIPLTQRVSQAKLCPSPISSQLKQNLSFDVVTNNAKTSVDFGPNIKSARKNIQFYLMKIGNWEGDILNIYANELLLKQLQFSNEGGPICSNQSNQSNKTIGAMSFHQFDIQDDSQKVSLQFESVRKDPKNDRKFAIAKLLVYPQGCIQCSNYNFIYKTQYNYDERLFIQMAFNLAYQNKDPNQFKNIFRVKAGDREYKYDITANDSIRYWLRSQPLNQSEIYNKNVTVDCLYPLRVTTKIPINGTAADPIADANRVQFFERLLQASNSFQNTKTLDNSLASVFVERYSPLRQETSGVLGSQTFFSILTRIVIYVGLASFFFGCQTPCTHVMHNFQKLWVHIYVASLALSPVLKTALWGFRQSQDQNIAINPKLWQSGLPRFLYYDAPAQYQQYYHDITFFRNIYNVGVAFAILTLVFIVFNCFLRNWKTNLTNSNIFLRHMKITFVNRPLFYFNSIIFYQYFTVVLACCLQFLDLRTNTNQSTFGGINAAACIIAFIFATLYPILFHILLNIKRRPLMALKDRILTNNWNKVYDSHAADVIDMQDQHVIYNNKYSQIFYRFLEKGLWNDKIAESEMISQKNFFYNIFRFGDLWWHAIVVILLHSSPFAQAFLLVLTNGFHLALNTFSSLNTTKYFRILKSLQLLFFMVIEIMIIVMASLFSTLNYDSYKAIGIVALIFVYLIVFVTFVRFFYTFYRIYRQYMHNYETDPRGVIRQEKGFHKGWINQNTLT